MLKKFEVKNFMNFKDKTIIDFSEFGGYRFNQDCITNQFISKMIIYGRNATGKTNLGKALLDITHKYSDISNIRDFDNNYLNADCDDEYAEFTYTFKFGNDEVIYKYKKISKTELYDEELILNNVRGFYINFKTLDTDFNNLKILEADSAIIDRYLQSYNLMKDSYSNDNLSFLRWLISNTALSEESILLKLDNYINNMRMISVKHLNKMVPSRMYDSFFEKLDNEGELKDFEDFLNVMGINCKLKLVPLPEGQKKLYFKYKKLVPFFETASSGTLALTNLYRIIYKTKKSSMMFLDEFDAFYHYEMSENVVRFFKKKYPNCQIIMTTHNTNLMTNILMRPDCLFILSREGKLTSLNNATFRELREGHNLEKMYISGEFDRYE